MLSVQYSIFGYSMRLCKISVVLTHLPSLKLEDHRFPSPYCHPSNGNQHPILIKWAWLIDNSAKWNHCCVSFCGWLISLGIKPRRYFSAVGLLLHMALQELLTPTFTVLPTISQDVEMIQSPIQRRMDKENVIALYTRLLCYLSEEEASTFIYFLVQKVDFTHCISIVSVSASLQLGAQESALNKKSINRISHDSLDPHPYYASQTQESILPGVLGLDWPTLGISYVE